VHFSKPIFFVCQLQKKKTMKESKKTLVLNKAILTVKCDPRCNTKWSKQYNDQLQFEMTTSFRENQLAFNKYQTVRQGKEATLTPEEKTVMKL
jgi:hypothetical protein